MYPGAFRYLRPDSLEEALAALETHGHDARPLAGGQSLIPLMKLRMLHPDVVVDLSRIPDLTFLDAADGWLTVGALTRHAQVQRSDVVRWRLPVVHEAVSTLGDVQVRNLGTVGGAVAEADPAGDWGPVLVALGGEVTCVRRGHARTVDIGAFFVDFLASCLEPGELVTKVRVRMPPAAAGSTYLKLERRVGDFAVVSAAVHLTLTPDGRCEDVGIGLGGVGAVPVKPVAAEAALRGAVPDDRTLDEVAALVRAATDPIDDGRGPASYKRKMAGVIVRRAIDVAYARARDAGSTVGAGRTDD